MAETMGMVREIRKNAAIEVADSSDGLAAIRRPGCAAAIWRRQPDQRFLAWIESLHPDALPRTRMIVPPEEVRACVEDVFVQQQVPDSAYRAWLLEDIDRLARQFIAVLPAPFLRIRLDVVTTNMCRKFHIDSIVARLICTYRGTGTQYGIAAGGVEPQRIFTVPTGAPIVLRGTLWPQSSTEPSTSGLRHRSPPIEGTGETRLVLVVDPIFDLDEES